VRSFSGGAVIELADDYLFLHDDDINQPEDCACPEMGRQVIAGTTELLEDNGDTDSNYISGLLSGKNALGTPFSELVLPEAPVKISGDNNEVKTSICFQRTR
jgi:hypothetical protein